MGNLATKPTNRGTRIAHHVCGVEWQAREVVLTDNQLLETVRKALLMIVDAIEKYLNIEPTTAQIRKQNKNK